VKEVEKDAFASASIAQIYRGKSINGDEIVMKIRHEGILNNIQRWENIFSSIMKYFNLNININHFFQNIREQVDFTKEADNLQTYYRMYRKNHLVQIPKYYGGDTDVLIMSYIPSDNFQEVKDNLTNEEIGYYTILSRIIYQDNIFIKDVIHMDLHNGNWGINRDNKSIVLYDFGWVLKDQTDFKKFFILAHIGRIETLEFFLDKYKLRDNTGEMRTFVDKICEDKTIDTLHGLK
jgi:predicted unusual protein kinase regulating ubiquinone biosynthesis (AarF/ABC1/UbiB family)